MLTIDINHFLIKSGLFKSLNQLKIIYLFTLLDIFIDKIEFLINSLIKISIINFKFSFCLIYLFIP